MRSNLLNRALLIAGCLLLPSLAQAAEAGGEDGTIAMEPLGAPIIENGRVSGQLQVVLKIVPQTDEAGTEIAARKPVWQSKLLAALNEFARLNVSVYRPVDAIKLRAALLATLKQGGAKVKDVLLLDVVAY